MTAGGPAVAASPATVERFVGAAVDVFNSRPAHGRIERDLLIESAGDRARVRIALDGELAVLAPALGHLAHDPDGEADLRLYALSAPGLPPSPWPPSDFLPTGELRGFTEGRFLASFATEGRILNVFDRESGVGAFLCGPASELPTWELGAPLRHLLRWGMAPRGWQLVHGAVVGHADGAALLVGRGGSGKSTTTVACLADGMLGVGDDYCLVHVGSRQAHALFDTAKLDDASLGRFPHLVPARREIAPTGDKAHLSLRAAFPRGLVDLLPLRAMVMLDVGKRTEPPRRVGPSPALRALAPSTLMQLPADRPRTLAALGELTRALPAWSLTVGPDLARVPEAVARILQESAS